MLSLRSFVCVVFYMQTYGKPLANRFSVEPRRAFIIALITVVRSAVINIFTLYRLPFYGHFCPRRDNRLSLIASVYRVPTAIL